MSSCSLCRRLQEVASNSPFLIHEFTNSVLLVGDHQLFPGYCVLVLKSHVKELHDLDTNTRHVLIDELNVASKAVQLASEADKINIGSYGNMVPHLHWHIFPRKAGDQAWPKPPWVLMDRFNEATTSEAQAKAVAEAMRFHLK